MAKEMEAKVKIADPDALKRQVKALGGILKYSRFEVNVFYDTPQRKLDNRGEVLRLRSENYVDGMENISMTFKGKRSKGKLKIREEHEFNVSDFEQARLLVTALGYKEYFRFEKRRESYQLDDCLVEFDTLPYLGEFVEIEGTSEAKINKILKALGLENADLITEGYGGLLWADAKKNKRSKKLAVFSSHVIPRR